MTLLAGPGLYPQPWPFEYGDLSLVGFEFAPEQLSLYERSQITECYALRVSVMTDPQEKYFPTPWIVANDNGLALQYVPSLVVCSPADWEYLAGLDNVSDDDARFPSMPCRSLFFNDYEPEPEPHHMADMFRLWNLWPITHTQAVRIANAVLEWDDCELMELHQWIAVNTGELDGCEFLGGEEEEHEHIEVPSYGGTSLYTECKSAQQWYEAYWETYFVLNQVDGHNYHLQIDSPRLPDDLATAWSNLIASSQAGADAGLACVPHWKAARVRDWEKDYSPCLSLC